MSLSEVLYTACVYYFYRGEFMLYINLEPPRISLEPINPKLMARTKDGNWRFDNKITIPKEQLVYVKFLNPDGDRGLGPVDVIKDELITDARSGEYQKKFFENFGKIGGTLEDDLGMATQEDMRSLVNQFNQAHAGSANAYKTLGLPKGIKYSELSQTMREMEFLSGRKDIRDKVLAILGIHSAVFGITENITYQTQKDAMRMLWQLTLVPASYRIQEKLNQHFFNRYFPGYQCYFDFNSVKELQESLQEKVAQAEAYKRLGYTMNEVNDYFDLGMDDINEPIGKMRFVPSGMIPVEELLIEPEPTKSTNPEDNLDKVVKIIEEFDNKSANIHRVKQEFNKRQRSVEKQFVGKLRKYFSSQLGKVLAVIKEKKSINKTDINVILAMIDNLLEEEKAVLQGTLAPIYNKGSLEGSGLAIDTLRLQVAARVDEAVVGLMVNKIRNINNHTYNLIRNTIKEGILAGESVAEMSNRVIDIYKFNTARARIIAQTESCGVMNRSTDAEYKKAGVKKKVWIGTMDKSIRDSHAENNNIGEVDYNFTYSNGQQFPADGRGGAREHVS
jgi:HK97 family phage portal protein